MDAFQYWIAIRTKKINQYFPNQTINFDDNTSNILNDLGPEGITFDDSFNLDDFVSIFDENLDDPTMITSGAAFQQPRAGAQNYPQGANSYRQPPYHPQVIQSLLSSQFIGNLAARLPVSHLD